MPFLGLYSLLNLPPAHIRLSARSCFKLIHSQPFVVYIFGFFDHLLPTFGRHKKENSKSLFASSQSTCIYAFYTWLPSSLLSLFYETASQLSSSDMEAIWNKLIQRLLSLQSYLYHRAESLCLPSCIGLQFLRIFSVFRDSEAIWFSNPARSWISHSLHFYFSSQISHFLLEFMFPKVHSQGS